MVLLWILPDKKLKVNCKIDVGWLMKCNENEKLKMNLGMSNKMFKF